MALHSRGWGPRNADSAPMLSRVYSLAFFAECEAKERLADEVSTGGMCNALSSYYRKVVKGLKLS